MSTCSQHHSQSLTLLSVNSGRQQKCFYYCNCGACLAAGGCLSAEQMNSIVWLSSCFSAACFCGKCILIAQSYRTHRAPRLVPLCFHAALSNSCPHLLLSTPLISLSISFIVTFKLSKSVAI